jgi:chaperonin cofactor prefoldin
MTKYVIVGMKIDFTELIAQKESLMLAIKTCEKMAKRKSSHLKQVYENLNGILHILDTIQDKAAENGLSEEEVFGKNLDDQ